MNIDPSTRSRTWLLRLAASLASLGLLASVASASSDPLETPTDAPVELPTELASDPHYSIFSTERYPSASECAECHKAIYDEWRGSAHANAAISPMFHKFEQALNTLAVGTVGAFCVRCHIPVGTTLGESRWMPIWERNETSIEGITCVVCHRVDEFYGRVNGERRMLEGSIFAPIYGSIGPDISGMADDENFGVSTEPGGDGTPMHSMAKRSDYLAKSEFCASCHQVSVHPGIKLEVVWEQYRDSPAFRDDISCQDCHMSSEPGLPSGFSKAPRAIVNQVPVKPDSKHTDHSFVGPGTSIVHPGIFPHNPAAKELATMKEWMSFDWEAGWGTVQFEKKLASGEIEAPDFPETWKDRSRRSDAARAVKENLGILDHHMERRSEIMERGSHLDGPFFENSPGVGRELALRYELTNTCSGHNLPSGSLGAQPEIWMNVALVDPDGNNVWESGYTDSQGDMADLHSHDVLTGKLPHDDQLFNLQSKFLTTNVKGTDREMYLPVNFDVDQIPFIRPGANPNTVMNHPPFVRMEQRSIPPLGMKAAKYKIPASAFTKPGTYKMAVRLRSRAEPIYFMKFVGATEEMVSRMNERMIDIHPYTVEFEVR